MQRKFNRKQNKYWIYVQTFIPEPFKIESVINNVSGTNFPSCWMLLIMLRIWQFRQMALRLYPSIAALSRCLRPRPQMYKESINEAARESDIEQLCPFVSHYPPLQSSEENAKCTQGKIFTVHSACSVSTFKGLRSISVN